MLLKEYIETHIIPLYADFDKAHREDHVNVVIQRSLDLADRYGLDRDMMYAAAAYHDTGLRADRKIHHLESGKIIRADANLRNWFSEEQIEQIAQAAEDHRASSETPPRSMYGCILAEADRLIDPMVIIRRTVQYGLSHYPDMDRDAHRARTVEHLEEKYGDGGYLKLWLDDSPNAAPLEELRAIIRNPDRTELMALVDREYEDQTSL